MNFLIEHNLEFMTSIFNRIKHSTLTCTGLVSQGSFLEVRLGKCLLLHRVQSYICI